MVRQLISRYKNYKKQGFLRQPERYQRHYAFVGAGGHSIDNLYPVLDFLAVPLKYIVTRRPENALRMAQRYPGATGVTDLSQVLSDEEVAGVFVCTQPAAHFQLAEQILRAGKGVFVEKPPCTSLAELDTLIENSGSLPFVVGLQKRYATVYQLLQKRTKQGLHYQFRYLTGGYPEGNPWWDLFIHPLDVAVFLFGPAKVLSVQRESDTFFVHLRHEQGTLGSLMLSTGYSWQTPEEQLEVRTAKGNFLCRSLNDLVFTPSGASVLGVPLEKVMATPPKSEQLYQNNGFVPLRHFNPLYAHGYAGELEAFVRLCEGEKATNLSHPSDIRPTFALLEELAEAYK